MILLGREQHSPFFIGLHDTAIGVWVTFVGKFSSSPDRVGRIRLIYCITTVTRDRHPLFTDINAARLLVHELRRLHEYGDVTSYDRAARKHDDIRRIDRYIVANPLRAGLVQNIGDYPHWDCIWMTD